MKAFYSEYIRHCMRFYARHSSPEFRNDTDKENWNACDSALKEFSDREQDMLLFIYGESDSVHENISRLSRDRNPNQNMIWKLVNDFERKAASMRGLI